MGSMCMALGIAEVASLQLGAWHRLADFQNYMLRYSIQCIQVCVHDALAYPSTHTYMHAHVHTHTQTDGEDRG